MAEEKDELVFPNAVIVREIKKHIDEDKMVKREVKEGMNKFLEEVLADVAEKMNQYPYAMIDHRMFKESIRPYKKVKELKKEKERMQAHMEKIVQDCRSVQRDLEEKLS